MADTLALSPGALEQLKALASRSHDGEVRVRTVERFGLPWIEVNVFLTDMDETSPLKTFLMSPCGVLKPAWVPAVQRKEDSDG